MDLFEDLLTQMAFEWPETLPQLLAAHPGWLLAAYSVAQTDIAAFVDALPAPYESSRIDGKRRAMFTSTARFSLFGIPTPMAHYARSWKSVCATGRLN